MAAFTNGPVRTAGGRRVDSNNLVALQNDPSRIRNVCILAHVDHGKTTLSDGLVCSNGIISSKLAGKLRYLDSTEDEQIRGITMKSSAISLLYNLEARGKQLQSSVDGDNSAALAAPVPTTSPSTDIPSQQRAASGAANGKPAAPIEAGKGQGGSAQPGPYLINLIDSPGHIDFSSDVSTATRLCDCGLIVVDVLEGVCAQTHAVVRQAWNERMRPLLVLNKVDRLVSELRLTPLEAWHHLRRLVENVNALTATLLVAENFKTLRDEPDGEGPADDPEAEADLLAAEVDEEEETEMERMWTFRPEKGDVVFCSALDGWGFGLGHFARIWAKRLLCRPPALRRLLWGDYVYSNKTKKVMRWNPRSAAKPMFVTMILDPIWQLYEVALHDKDTDRASKMAVKLGLEVPPRELSSKEPRGMLQAIMKRWLPVAEAVLRMVVEAGASPAEVQLHRLGALWPLQAAETAASSAQVSSGADGQGEAASLAAQIAAVRESIASCNASQEAPVVIFVSKMVAVRKTDIRDTSGRRWEPPGGATGGDTAEDTEATGFVALARILSGTVTSDSAPLYVLGAKYHPARPGAARHLTLVQPEGAKGAVALFMMMGSSLHPVDRVPAGNVLGIAGLEGVVQKCATVSSTTACPALRAITLQAKPIMRVAVEAAHQRDMAALEKGLGKLFQADPAVEVSVTDRGEHIVACLGELHLEQCLKDLREIYAKVPVNSTPPLVSFRESVLVPGQAVNETGQPVRPSQMSQPPWSDEEGLKSTDPATGRVRLVTPDREVALTLRCTALPEQLSKLLDQHPDEVRDLLEQLRGDAQEDTLEDAGAHPADAGATKDRQLSDLSTGEEGPAGFRSRLASTLAECREQLQKSALVEDRANGGASVSSFLSRVLAFGPRGCGANLLLTCREGVRVYVSRAEGGLEEGPPPTEQELAANCTLGGSDARARAWRLVQNALAAGFQLATAASPLAGEEMYGVAFVTERIEITPGCIGLPPPPPGGAGADSSPLPAAMPPAPPGEGGAPSPPPAEAHVQQQRRHGPLSGQVISASRVACKAAFLCCPVRLVEAFYQCSLQCDQLQLGNMYGVLARRRGRVIKEDLVEGTQLFLLDALLPVAESFGFAHELLKRTSGSGTAPQLSFSHWELMEIDPFWRPLTEEEREDEGEEGHLSQANVARVYIDQLRKRKGLASAEKIVVAAEKQRTLTKSK